ncbi:hypothetical protein [Xanthobacter autotrophicus]|uniref:hypothetical protein n=1 Tax=Xanthobacter autotrophicus TaxID=280 RepID=UPI0037274278
MFKNESINKTCLKSNECSYSTEKLRNGVLSVIESSVMCHESAGARYNLIIERLEKYYFKYIDMAKNKSIYVIDQQDIWPSRKPSFKGMRIVSALYRPEKYNLNYQTAAEDLALSDSTPASPSGGNLPAQSRPTPSSGNLPAQPGPAPSMACIVTLPGTMTLNSLFNRSFSKYQNNCQSCAKLTVQFVHCGNNITQEISIGSGFTGEVSFPANPSCGNAIHMVRLVSRC